MDTDRHGFFSMVPVEFRWVSRLRGVVIGDRQVFVLDLERISTEPCADSLEK